MSCETPSCEPVHHIFVDFENVKKCDLTWVGARNTRLHLFIGAQQKKLDVELVGKLMQHASTVELIMVKKSGKNALDFVLAYHVGREVLADPRGYFHIIARDSGYDALVEFLGERNVRVKRHADWQALGVVPEFWAVARPAMQKPGTPAQGPAGSALPAGAAKVFDGLKKSEMSRPKKLKTLIPYVQSLLGKDQPVDLAREVIDELEQAGKLQVDEKGSVIYQI